eukprot:CAMPEP_0181254356 /NCGR_PEP_ID=MMETSP1096-20121128/48561_1 /TAXON_ID=156174 ORGANISM="Chrysochromulina ericina, Strain CCMP281" /NCGR_SAMPLE_ID=MMETSP1096 /ASSEMBLY_ACC=CAM_ASM_000453 /LENGTH=118 /DNA_ID=CAMNT_0023352389 /DNA_START=269 /DNA_END=625 /DNA_ORIENTATION=+
MCLHGAAAIKLLAARNSKISQRNSMMQKMEAEKHEQTTFRPIDTCACDVSFNASTVNAIIAPRPITPAATGKQVGETRPATTAPACAQRVTHVVQGRSQAGAVAASRIPRRRTQQIRR